MVPLDAASRVFLPSGLPGNRLPRPGDLRKSPSPGRGSRGPVGAAPMSLMEITHAGAILS